MPFAKGGRTHLDIVINVNKYQERRLRPLGIRQYLHIYQIPQWDKTKSSYVFTKFHSVPSLDPERTPLSTVHKLSTLNLKTFLYYVKLRTHISGVTDLILPAAMWPWSQLSL